MAVVAAGLGLILISLLFDAAPLFVPAVALALIGLAARRGSGSAPAGRRRCATCRPSAWSRRSRWATTIEIRRGPLGLPGAEVVDPFTGSRLRLGGRRRRFAGGGSPTCG